MEWKLAPEEEAEPAQAVQLGAQVEVRQVRSELAIHCRQPRALAVGREEGGKGGERGGKERDGDREREGESEG